MSSDNNPDAKTDLQRRFLIGSSLAFAGTAASGVLTGCGGVKAGSKQASGGDTLVAGMPTFAPGGGAYTSAQNVTISTTTSGATIHWTTDGTAPTVSSAVYGGAIPVNTTATVRAIAAASGYQPSNVSSAAYTISEMPQVATPMFTPVGGDYASAQTVTISSATSGVTIYYTTDGSTPTTSSSQYSSPLTVSSTETVNAIAIAAGDAQSAVGSATYTINDAALVATPTFMPVGGAYSSAQTVAISCTTSGATIYYTTDGSAPTTSSSQYSSPLTVSSTETVKAMATAAGDAQSAVAMAAYTIGILMPLAATPTFTPAAGNYSGARTVTISCATSGAAIHYTTNNSTPTTGSPVYTTPISVGTTETVKAIATAAGYQQSAVGSAWYTISSTMPLVATPTFTPTAGTYSGAQTVTISCATSGAAIHYTTNGSTPTTGSPVYTTPISVGTTETVKAIATAAGYQQSAVGSASYTIASSSGQLTITTASSLPNAIEGNSYTEKMTATGGVPPYTWALVSGIGSTNKWTVSPVGVVSGSPVYVETDTVSIKVTDSASNVAGPQSFSIAVQSSSGLPSAPVDLQLINQGGPNNADAQDHYVWQGFTFYYSSLATGYQGFSWLSATPGSNPVAHYKIYRNGVAYDTVATPITITGYIVPSEDLVTQYDIPNGTLHVTAVSGGTTSISDGKILCGLLLTSSAPGFVAGTRVNVAKVYTGSGGTGTYYVTCPQTCGSASSPVTFQGWSYNDTESSNCTYPGFNAPGVIYSYAVSAVDAQGSEGPKAYPSVYQFYGYSNTLFGNFDYPAGVTQTWNDTSGAPLNGPYDTYSQFTTNGGGLLMTFGGFAPYPPYGTGTVPGCLCPSSRLEVGAFNYLVFDIKPTDNTFETSELQYYGVTRAYGNSGGGDNGHWNLVDCRPYCTPPLAVGQWSHCKVPFSALTYGLSNGNGSFVATSQYNGTLTITSFTSLPVRGPDGSAYVSGPGIPANTYINMANYNSNESPPSGPGPWVYQVMSPNIVGSETGTGSYTFQNTSVYKHGFQWSPAASSSSNLGNWYMNNIGFATA